MRAPILTIGAGGAPCRAASLRLGVDLTAWSPISPPAEAGAAEWLGVRSTRCLTSELRIRGMAARALWRLRGAAPIRGEGARPLQDARALPALRRRCAACRRTTSASGSSPTGSTFRGSTRSDRANSGVARAERHPLLDLCFMRDKAAVAPTLYRGQPCEHRGAGARRPSGDHRVELDEPPSVRPSCDTWTRSRPTFSRSWRAHP